MIVNFSCPNCGADMSYDIKLGKLHCAHCDHSEDIRLDEENYRMRPKNRQINRVIV